MYLFFRPPTVNDSCGHLQTLLYAAMKIKTSRDNLQTCRQIGTIWHSMADKQWGEMLTMAKTLQSGMPATWWLRERETTNTTMPPALLLRCSSWRSGVWSVDGLTEEVEDGRMRQYRNGEYRRGRKGGNVQ